MSLAFNCWFRDEFKSTIKALRRADYPKYGEPIERGD